MVYEWDVTVRDLETGEDEKFRVYAHTAWDAAQAIACEEGEVTEVKRIE